MHNNTIPVIEEWVDEWVIGHNFCPFARPTRTKNTLRTVVCEATSWSAVYERLYDECQLLLANADISTTLLALTQAGSDFNEYLDLLEGANRLIENENWQGVFQLASFHPDYLFAGEPIDSPTHYTNRSPLPMLHLLRESEVSLAIPSQAEADEIVARNQRKLEQMGIATAQHKLEQWRKKLTN